MTSGWTRSATVGLTLVAGVVVGVGATAHATTSAPSGGTLSTAGVSPVGRPAHAVAVPTAGPAVGQMVVVMVPPVVFERRIHVRDGVLRTPVLITRPGATGIASVPGTPDCVLSLTAGVTGWLSCHVGRDHASVVVRMDDGAVASRAATPGR